MNHLTQWQILLTTASAALVLSTASAFAAPTVRLSFLVDNNPQTTKAMEVVAADFMVKNPNIKIEIEARPAGAEGDNLIKTRLATGEMTDVFWYNVGSLFQALNPSRNLLDLSNEASQANVLDSYKTVVSSGGRIYGVPGDTAQGGGILYNKKIYAKLGLNIPKTWEQFQKNNAAIKAAGLVPVIQTYRDTWTSQLLVLGDFHNVQAAEPGFAERYTQGKVKFASSVAAVKGFKHLEEVFKAGYLNKDFASAGYEDGLRMLAKGEGAHYPMLTLSIAGLMADHKASINDIGFFAIPGDDEAKNGLTAWMPAAVYIAKSTKHPVEAKKFLAYIASTEGCASQTKAIGVTGPYMLKSCTLPENIAPSVADLVSYFEPGAQNTPALEFLSPIKGPSLEQITVEVGSGIRKTADAAALYDEDVRKQALQLGIAGWK